MDLDPETFLAGLLAVDPVEIEPGQAWVSRNEREYHVTVIRPAVAPDSWVVLDSGEEREMTANEIISAFVLPT